MTQEELLKKAARLIKSLLINADLPQSLREEALEIYTEEIRLSVGGYSNFVWLKHPDIGEYEIHKGDYAELCDCAANDRKIPAIKRIRELTGLGIKNSKNLVEYFWTKMLRDCQNEEEKNEGSGE